MQILKLVAFNIEFYEVFPSRKWLAQANQRALERKNSRIKKKKKIGTKMFVPLSGNDLSAVHLVILCNSSSVFQFIIEG